LGVGVSRYPQFSHNFARFFFADRSGDLSAVGRGSELYETVYAIQSTDVYDYLFFWCLAIFGGVLGSLLSPLERLSRLAYVGAVLLTYLVAFSVFVAIGNSGSIAFVFWGYILIGIGTGLFTAWFARARSTDIRGDGRVAYLAFIPVISIYLMVAHSKHEGQSFSKTDPIEINIALALAAIVAVSGANAYVEYAKRNTDPEAFAQKIASMVEPRWLNTMTLLRGAEAVGTRVTVYHVIKGRDRFITDEALSATRRTLCETESKSVLFDRMGMEREFVYLDEDEQILGSFIAGCI